MLASFGLKLILKLNFNLILMILWSSVHRALAGGLRSIWNELCVLSLACLWQEEKGLNLSVLMCLPYNVVIKYIYSSHILQNIKTNTNNCHKMLNVHGLILKVQLYEAERTRAFYHVWKLSPKWPNSKSVFVLITRRTIANISQICPK